MYVLKILKINVRAKIFSGLCKIQHPTLSLIRDKKYSLAFFLDRGTHTKEWIESLIKINLMEKDCYPSCMY